MASNLAGDLAGKSPLLIIIKELTALLFLTVTL